jgi:hypothetical protein
MNLHLLQMAESAQGPRRTASPKLAGKGANALLWSTIQCRSEPDEARGHQVAESLAPVREAALSC